MKTQQHNMDSRQRYEVTAMVIPPQQHSPTNGQAALDYAGENFHRVADIMLNRPWPEAQQEITDIFADGMRHVMSLPLADRLTAEERNGLRDCHRQLGHLKGVLHGQITRITSHSDRIYLSFSIRAYGDLFGEYDEMVGGVGTRILSRRPCFPHDYKKMPVVCISENSGEFSRRPPFFSIGINMLDALESLFGFLCQPCTHNLIKTSAAVSCPYDVTLRGTTPAAESNILK